MKKAWRSSSAAAVLIMVLTVVAYIPTLHGGFVFDDDVFITNNRVVNASDGLHRIWFTTEAPHYYPLTWSLCWLEWRWWGANPTGYHVVNVLLHAVNAVLVWLILRRLNPAHAAWAGPGAWLAAAVFAIHPVNVATVAWVSEQKNTLSMFFYSLAILLYLRFDEESRPPRTGGRGWGWYGLSLTAGLLALLSKSAVVMLPVVLLGCAWWRRRRVRWQDVLCSAPFFVLSLISGLVTIWFEYRDVRELTVQTGGFFSRLAAAGRVPWFYLSKALLPVNLTVMYPKWEIDPTRWISYVPGVVLLGAFAVCWRKRTTWGRPLLFGLGYFVVVLFPVLGFFDQGFFRYSLVADHWQYYSIIGVIALAVAGGARIGNRMGDWGQTVGVLASVAVLAVLGVATWNRGGVYANEETLWRDNVTRNPNAWAAHNNLGSALIHAGKLEEAIAHCERALRIKPDHVTAHNNLGVALARLGRLKEAIGHYEQALKIKPDYAQVHSNLGLALSQVGRLDDAIRHCEEALRLKPGMAEAHNNLGVALVRLGRVTEAIGHYEQALKIKPDYDQAHSNLGLALSQVGKIDDAIRHYEEALRLKPEMAEAHYNLGLALEQTIRLPEAIRHYEQALRLKPDYAEAQNNLAWLLATLAPPEGGNPARAVTLAQHACELTGNQAAPYLDTLAAAYAAAGRFNDAVATAQKAIALGGTAGQPQVVREIEVHLELYRSGRAYRRPVQATSPSQP